MKKIALIFLLAVSLPAYADNTDRCNDGVSIDIDTKNLILLDQIEAVVFGQEDQEIVTKSDMDRPSLGGGFRTKDDIIFEKKIFLDAKKHKIPQDEEAVEAYLAQIQREHNMSEKELEQIFTASGYTIEEGRQQLQMMQTINTMLDIKIRSNLIVPRKDVEQYYHEHPVMIEATYTLQRMFVPLLDRMSERKQRAMLIKFAKTGKGSVGATWGETFTIEHSDIAEGKNFIYVMKAGDISLPEPVEGGFEMFRLVEKTEERLKTLDESYREIVDILKQPKYEELMEKYRTYLSDHSSVVYF